MTDVLDAVHDHYHATGLTERLKTVLMAFGPEDQRLTPKQLSAVAPVSHSLACNHRRIGVLTAVFETVSINT